MADRVISRGRNNEVAFGSKQTLNGRLDRSDPSRMTRSRPAPHAAFAAAVGAKTIGT
jgi:hypothetical protein